MHCITIRVGRPAQHPSCPHSYEPLNGVSHHLQQTRLPMSAHPQAFPGDVQTTTCDRTDHAVLVFVTLTLISTRSPRGLSLEMSSPALSTPMTSSSCNYVMR